MDVERPLIEQRNVARGTADGSAALGTGDLQDGHRLAAFFLSSSPVFAAVATAATCLLADPLVQRPDLNKVAAVLEADEACPWLILFHVNSFLFISFNFKKLFEKKYFKFLVFN